MLGAAAVRGDRRELAGPPLVIARRLAEQIEQAVSVVLEARHQLLAVLAVRRCDPRVELLRGADARPPFGRHQLLLQARVAVERQRVRHHLRLNGRVQRFDGEPQTRPEQRAQGLDGGVALKGGEQLLLRRRRAAALLIAIGAGGSAGRAAAR